MRLDSTKLPNRMIRMLRSACRTSLLLVLLSSTAGGVRAQDFPPPEGTRVRALPSDSPGEEWVGTVQWATRDSIGLLVEWSGPDDVPVRVAYADLDSLQVSEHLGNRAFPAAVTGAVIGFVIGGIDTNFGSVEEYEGTTWSVGSGSAIGAAAGGLVGFLVGMRVDRYGPWVAVDVDSAGGAPARGLVLGLRWAPVWDRREPPPPQPGG